LSTEFAVTATFFKNYVEDLPRSVVYLAFCRSMFASDLRDVLLAKGAAAVLVYMTLLTLTSPNESPKGFSNACFVGRDSKKGSCRLRERVSKAGEMSTSRTQGLSLHPQTIM